MQHPRRRDCPDRQFPTCRNSCEKLAAWQQMKEIERKQHEKTKLINSYVVDACRAAKRGARRHDGRFVR